MSIEIKTNAELSYENMGQLVDMAVQATKEIYGPTSRPNKIKTVAAMTQAISGQSQMVYLAAPVDSDTGKVVGFTFGFVSPMLIEDGLNATAVLTYVDPVYASGGWAEKLLTAFEDWAVNTWRAVDIRMDFCNPANSEQLARIAERIGYPGKGFISFKRMGV